QPREMANTRTLVIASVSAATSLATAALEIKYAGVAIRAMPAATGKKLNSTAIATQLRNGAIRPRSRMVVLNERPQKLRQAHDTAVRSTVVLYVLRLQPPGRFRRQLPCWRRAP